MKNLELSRGMKGLRWLLAPLLLTACVSAKESPQVGGESHFLSRCDDSCGAGLDCLQGVCTRPCEPNEESCAELSRDAVCTAEGSTSERAQCDVACTGSGDCARISASHRCEAGFCRAPAVTSGGGGSPGGGSGSDSFPTDRVFTCPAEVASDPIEVLHSVIVGNELRLQVAYSGGCRDHAVSVCLDDAWRESYPVETSLRVIHDGGGDACEAGIMEALTFDLTPLADLYERNYRSQTGLIETNFGLYAFGALSCEERSRGAEMQLTDYEEKAAGECTTADDCGTVTTNTRCTAGCGAVVAKENIEQYSSWLAVMEEEVCRDYEADGCPPLPLVDCGELRPACIAGRCRHR